MSNGAVLGRVLRNAGALLAAYLVPRALTFTAALLAARVLRPAAFGSYGTAAALAMTLSVLCTLGMLPLLVREVARAPGRGASLVAAANRIKLAASLLMLAGLALAARLLELPADAVRAALVLAVGHVFWGLAESYGARLQAEERMSVWLRANVVFGVSAALLSGAAVWFTQSVPWFCAGIAAGQAAALLYLLLRTRPEALDREAVRAEVRYLARASVPFGLAFLALTVFYKFDVLLLARLSDAHSVGIYTASYKLVDVAHALAVIGAAAVYPRLSRAVGNEASRRTLELALLGASTAAAILWLLREPVILVLYGAEYVASASVLSLLAPATAVLAVNIVAGYLLALANRPGLLAQAYGTALLVKLGCGLLWVPGYSAGGAAAAMLVGELAATATLGAALVRAAVPLPRSRNVLLAAGAAGGAAACGLVPEPLLATSLFACCILLLYAFGGALAGRELNEIRALLTAGGRRMPETT